MLAHGAPFYTIVQKRCCALGFMFLYPYLALLLLAYHCWLVRAYLALLWIAFHCLLDQQLGQQCFEEFKLINLKDGFTTLLLGGGGWTKLISLAATFAPTGVKH